MYLKNRDLILISLIGFIYYAIVVGLQGHLAKLPSGGYFFAPFMLSVFMGIVIQESTQVMEWPLCFLFGGTLGSASIMGILGYLGMSFSLFDVAKNLIHTLSWFGLLAALMLIGILVGYFLRWTFNMILGSLRVSLQ